MLIVGDCASVVKQMVQVCAWAIFICFLCLQVPWGTGLVFKREVRASGIMGKSGALEEQTKTECSRRGESASSSPGSAVEG